MRKFLKADGLILVGLLALCGVPVLAGIMRLHQISASVVTTENARFLAAPWPVGLHIVGASIFCVLGAFQFVPGLRRRWIRGHRILGRISALGGGVAAISGLWMTQFYPAVEWDGPALYWMRLGVGATMALSIGLSIKAILKGDIDGHRAWMIRGYALGMGAATQVITHLPWFLFPQLQGEASRTLFMAAGWGINIVLAEWIIGRPQRTPSG